MIYCYQYCHRLYLHPLANFPGPRLARASSLWSSSAARKLRRAQAIQEAHDRYGPVVRVGPNELSFSSSTVLKDIYGHGSALPKSAFYAAGKFSSVDNIFSMRNRHQHSARRSLMAKMYSQTNVWTYAPLISEKILQIVDQVLVRGDQGKKPIDMYSWCHFFGLDVIRSFLLPVTLLSCFAANQPDCIQFVLLSTRTVAHSRRASRTRSSETSKLSRPFLRG